MRGTKIVVRLVRPRIAPEILTTDVEEKRLVLEIRSEQTPEGRGKPLPFPRKTAGV